MNPHQKIITLSFIIAGVLAALITRVLLNAVASTGFLIQFYSLDAFQHGIPVGVGILTFIFLQFNKKIVTWAKEVVLEISHIVWPSRKDTAMMTLVCCIMLLIAAILLGAFDFLASHAMRLFLN